MLTVKLRLAAVFDAQHGGFATGWSSISWGSIDELFVNLTMPGSVVRRIDRVDPLINHGLLGCHGQRERQARLLDEPAPVCYDPFPPTD